MERLQRSDETIALGKRLVEELGLEDGRSDALSRWMAHDIAERLREAETAVGPAREAARRACSEAILNLWVHRMAFPDGHRPMQDAETAARIMARLDPDAERTLLYRAAALAPSHDNPWLQTAAEIDRGARAMMRACVRLAALGDEGKAVEFANLAEAAGLGREPDTVMLRIIIMGESDDKPNADETARRDIEADLKAMRRLAALNRDIGAALRERLSLLPKVRASVIKAARKLSGKR